MLKKLHKIIGLSVCLIIIHLSITGIILMYPSTFKLQETYFKNRYISGLYDMYTVADVRALEAAEEDLGIIKSKAIVSDMVIETGINNILGALKANNLIFVLNNKKLILIQESDYGLEIIKDEKIPFTALSIGKDKDNILIKGTEDNFYIVNKNLSFSLAKNNEIEFNEIPIHCY